MHTLSFFLGMFKKHFGIYKVNPFGSRLCGCVLGTSSMLKRNGSAHSSVCSCLLCYLCVGTEWMSGTFAELQRHWCVILYSEGGNPCGFLMCSNWLEPVKLISVFVNSSYSTLQKNSLTNLFQTTFILTTLLP